MVDYEAPSMEESLVEFTGEDCFGRYLVVQDICCDNQLERPMGWDGKPIPYWLDKLGLGQEYRCEICSNRSYAGKKAFERHFKEWRHQQGLLLNGASIEEARAGCMGLPTQMRNPWPLGVDGKVRPPLDLSQITDQGTEGNDSVQAPAILDAYLADAERMVHNHLSGATDGSLWLPPAGYRDASLLQEPLKFTCRVPQGITGKELDIIELAAQFWALNGGRLWEGCKERSNTDPQFEFMKPTGGSRSTLFRELASAYFEVVNRPEILKETLKEDAADMETVLENCFYRLQLDRFLEEEEDKAREEQDKDKAREEEQDKDKAREEDKEKEKAKGCVTVCVYAPDCASRFYQDYFDFDMVSLSETVASLKEKIAQKVRIPATHQILCGKFGILEDNNKSLAHYNVGHLNILDLSFKGFNF